MPRTGFQSPFESGVCHCGKPGLVIVPVHGKMNGKNLRFFCGDHQEEARLLMSKSNAIRCHRSDNKLETLNAHRDRERLVSNPKGKFQSQPGTPRARKRI